MLQGMYAAASGLTAALQNQDVRAENIAHATVPGYRRHGLAYETFEQAVGKAGGPAPSGPQGTQAGRGYTDFQPGPYLETGSPFDLVVQGNGFFVLQGPSGPVYTRNGSFHLNERNQLIGPGGLTVNGDGGAITLPAGAPRITIGSDGSVSAGGAPVGRVRIVSFADPNRLNRVGTTLFEAPADSPPQPSTATVLQGAREGSNVQVVEEMVYLITGMRHYEAATRSLRALSDAVEQRTKDDM